MSSTLLAQSLQATAPPYWWVSPLVIFFGAVVAIIAILTNRRVARMRATLDLIERTESSEHYLEIRRSFRVLIDDGSAETLKRLTAPKNDTDKATAQKIYAYMNHYELVAIGCSAGILDEPFYAKWMRTTLVRDWHVAKAFILSSRTRPHNPAPAAFIEFEALARRFETNVERGHRFARYRGKAHQYFSSRTMSS